MLTQAQKVQIIDLVQAGTKKQEIAKFIGCDKGTITKQLLTRKRCMVIADLHCGHKTGLTPPDWQQPFSKLYPQQVEMWDWYEAKCKELKPDIVLMLGDIVDGKDSKSGATEQITASFKEQLEMARYCLIATGTKNIVGVYGTGYHTSENGEDFEDFLGIKVGGHEFPMIHNIQLDLKHKIGSSSIPHGRFNALAKTKLWNEAWSNMGGQPSAQLIIRGHVHYYKQIRDNYFVGFTCPALCGWGSRYGVRQCEGVVETGLVWFDVYEGTTIQNFQCRCDIPDLTSQKVEVYSL